MGECGFSHARHQSLPIEDAKRLSRELSELLAGVDIIGLRAFGPNPSDVHIRKISQAIDTKNLRGALGMIEALQYGDRAVKNGEFRNTVLTSAWVHLGFLELLDVVLDNAPRVVVITGRHELETLFSEKLKSRLAAFLPIPVQASDQSSPERPFHYPTRYKEIIEALRTDLRGTLVLAGAGIFGKKYFQGDKYRVAGLLLGTRNREGATVLEGQNLFRRQDHNTTAAFRSPRGKEFTAGGRCTVA
jgi:hypothetical protein